MQSETQILWQRIRESAAKRNRSNVIERELEGSVVSGTTHITVDEVGNSSPPEITITVGTTRSFVAVDDPSCLPPPISDRYFASPSAATWHDRYGEAWEPGELAQAWLELFNEYVVDTTAP